MNQWRYCRRCAVGASWGLLLLLASSVVWAETQNVIPLIDQTMAPSGTPLDLSLDYDTSDGNSELTGLGVRMHWDSNRLRFSGLNRDDLFDYTGMIAGMNAACQDDTETDYDGDPCTDCSAQAAWVDVDGLWPGRVPITLLTTRFTSRLEPGETTLIRFSRGGTALGYDFDAPSVQLTSGQVTQRTLGEWVQAAYVGYYGRPADCPGYGFWVSELAAVGGDLSDIIDAFGNSDEYLDRFGHLTDEQLIDQLYLNLFDREPDPAGKAFYIEELSSERMTLPTIAHQVLVGALNCDYTIIENKMEVGTYFTDRLCEYEMVYTDLDDAIGVVSAVDWRDASVDLAKDATDRLIPGNIEPE